jgi:acetyltransferase-like isoleucine patch superfamily enzyme
VTVSRSVDISSGVRVTAARGARVVLCPGAVLGEGARISALSGTVVVGRDARLGERAIVVGHAGVTIEAGAVVGDWAAVSDVEPPMFDSERPVRTQGVVASPVVIGAGAILGPHAAVSASVASGTVVAPYAVVERRADQGRSARGARRGRATRG